MTISKENGDWAFPTNSEKMGVATTGMTLRQYFAGQALIGLLAKYGIDNWTAQGRDKYDKSRSTDSAGTAAPDKTMPEFMKSMESSVEKATTEVDDEEEDPFNYNQLFIASILKGLKPKQPATAGGRASGTYIPKPDLPRMSDYDSNKTYWNIG